MSSVDYNYFRQNTPASYGTFYCSIHCCYYTSYCPGCSTLPKQTTTVTVNPVLTEDAIAAMVKAFDQIINDLRKQVADRDQRLERLQGDYDRLHQQVADLTDNA
jgi:hypothetical protein